MLRGTVTPNGTDTTAWLEWGTDWNYGNRSTPMSVSGGDALQITNLITGLSPAQVYYYHVVASNAVGVVSGGDHQIAIGKTVVGWGNNAYGQTNVPVGLSNVVAVAAADTHSLALRSDGMVVAWGNNYYGQISVPTDLSNVAAVACGGNYSLALKTDGTVVAWGDDDRGQSRVPNGLSNVVAVFGGRGYCLALKNDGTIVAWGDNTYTTCQAA